jgi:hypothetical protein
MGDRRIQNFIKTEENNFVFMKKNQAFGIIRINQYDKLVMKKFLIQIYISMRRFL